MSKRTATSTAFVGRPVLGLLFLLCLRPVGAEPVLAPVSVSIVNEPALADAPLRAENITDNEVREIQRAIPQRWRGDILNISGVVAGCYCEVDSRCSAQVAVRVKREMRERRLIFSRIDNQWEMSRLQAWQLRREQIDEVCRSEKVRRDTSLLGACLKKEQQILAEAPICY